MFRAIETRRWIGELKIELMVVTFHLLQTILITSELLVVSTNVRSALLQAFDVEFQFS